MGIDAAVLVPQPGLAQRGGQRRALLRAEGLADQECHELLPVLGGKGHILAEKVLHFGGGKNCVSSTRAGSIAAGMPGTSDGGSAMPERLRMGF